MDAPQPVPAHAGAGVGSHPLEDSVEHVHGPLRPGELAEVAVLGDLALALEVVGWFAPPFIAGVFQALAILPFAVLASRHRMRAGVIAVIGAATVAGLVGGVGVVIETSLAGVVGISIGSVQRLGRRPIVAVGVAALFGGVPLALLTLLTDALSPGTRKLTFGQVKVLWRAIAHGLESFGYTAAAHRGNNTLAWLLGHWWLTVPVVEVLVITVITLACMPFRHVLNGLMRTAIAPYRGLVTEHADPGRPVQAVPARIEGVTYRYPGADTSALDAVSTQVDGEGLMAIVGDNGSGKSTLVRLLAGRYQPTSGTIERPGRPGYGELSGTASIFQRPESQVLGVRVRDDLWWGLAPGERSDPAVLLAEVGLSGFEDRETSTLSGGQLQRLAIASALARRPQLLISDESTAMVDDAGRRELVSLYTRLAGERTAVVHVTHREEEAAAADRVLRLDHGRVVDGHRDPSPPPRPVGLTPAEVATMPILATLRRVGHVYARRSPWEHRALEAIDLDIREGEGIVVTGENGSGKTTLAWILGGLLHPSEGEARIGAALVDDVPEEVAVAFQHASFQLLKRRVLADVMIGIEGDEEEAKRAAMRVLEEVGFDAHAIKDRRVDELSGGEQRRVVLAGLLARSPRLLVLDEPYAGLDTPSRRSLARVLARLRTERRIGTVVVSHDLDEAGELGTRLLTLQDGRLVSEEALAP